MGIQHLKDGLIAGMILGDGHLHKNFDRLELLHCISQESYLVFKLGLAQQVGYTASRHNNRNVKTNLGLQTRCTGVIRHGDLSKFYGYSLENLLNTLNPLGLLIWWLDDGSLTIHQKQNDSISRFGYLNTQGYGEIGNRLIARKLLERFGIEANIHIDTKTGFAKSDHFRIYINATNLRRMIDLVREYIPWIPKNMLYKLNMKYVSNRLALSEQYVELYNF